MHGSDAVPHGVFSSVCVAQTFDVAHELVMARGKRNKRHTPPFIKLKNEHKKKTNVSLGCEHSTAAPRQDFLFHFRQREMNCAGGDCNAALPGDCTVPQMMSSPYRISTLMRRDGAKCVTGCTSQWREMRITYANQVTEPRDDVKGHHNTKCDRHTIYEYDGGCSVLSIMAKR